MRAADDFWDRSSDYAVGAALDEETVAAVEASLGVRLPASYLALMRARNGGVPQRTCYPTAVPTSWAEDHVAIETFLPVGKGADGALLNELGEQSAVAEWGYPDIGVYICDCPSGGHDMVALDYRACGPDGAPRVVHVENEGETRITDLAEDFAAFAAGLLPPEAFEPSEEEVRAERATLQHVIREGRLSTRLRQALAAAPELEPHLRGLLVAQVEEKGGLYFHADQRSRLTYATLLHLLLEGGETVDRARFLGEYPKFIAGATDGDVRGVGYAIGFVEDWWEDWVREGAIRSRWLRSGVELSVDARALLLGTLRAY